MKILFLGSTQGSACALHYFTSLIRLGHSVLPFDPAYFTANSFLEKVSIRLKGGPTRRRVEQVAGKLVGLCRRNHFDIVFVMAENFLSGTTIEEIKSLSKPAPLFLYHSHDNNFSNGICKPVDFFKTLSQYDYVFTTKSQNVERYTKLGQPNAFFIPSAYEPAVHRPIEPQSSRYKDKNLQVTFVGTYDHSRDCLLERAGWARLHVWGSHWQRFPQYKQYQSRIFPSPIYYFEFADVLTHSEISLGLLRKEAEDRHTQRTFEIPACGSLQVTPRTEEILSFFEEDKEIVCFDGLDELKEKLDYYLAHPTERARIAKAGHERCLIDKHTYQDRVEKMLSLATR